MLSRALEKRFILRAGFATTFLGFGALEIGRDWGFGTENQRRRPTEDIVGEVLNTVLDAGINLIDTASAYHKSEERIGKYISCRRNEYILSTKCGEHSCEPKTYYDFSYNAIKRSIDNSLKLLKTDVIDIMFIHFGPEPEKVLSDGETLCAMKEAKKEGKIRFLGASTNGEFAKECILSGDFDFMQMDYNLIDRRNEKNIELCEERGMGVFVRTGLARGLLTAKVKELMDTDFPKKDKVEKLIELVEGNYEELAKLALHFLYQTPGVSSVLVGTKNPENIIRNIQIIDSQIDSGLLSKAINLFDG